MRLSIIIPLYNVENFVGICIQSILNQNLDSNDYEIIVIDDDSTDNSVSIVERFKVDNKNIFIYHQANSGVGSARNKGISLAKGKYIYFIDPDDYLASNVLKTILDYGDEYDLQVLTFSSIETTNTNLDISSSNCNGSFPINKMNGISYIGDVGYKSEVWWYIVKRSFLEEIKLNFIVGRWMEDAIFTTNLLLKAECVAHLPIDAHRHVKVEGSAMTSKEPKHYVKVIHDKANAVKEFNRFVEEVRNSKQVNLKCLKRLETRQQSFVFFMLIRILKSKLSLKSVKAILESMIELKAYPLNKFIGKDYNGIKYEFITRLFNIKHVYILLFLILNPFFRR